MDAIHSVELARRLKAFCAILDRSCPDWQTAVLFSKVNQYYLTGTMQDGFLMIHNDRSARYFVRRSYERALEESAFRPMIEISSYRDAATLEGADIGVTCFETEFIPLALLQRFQKHFRVQSILSLDKAILIARSVKTEYEISIMEKSGKLHHELLCNRIPGILREGMSEADFGIEIFAEMMRLGYQGISRFSMLETEMVAGQIGFGESSVYPTSFDGPGGARGIGSYAPVLGNRSRYLKKGDLVFADIAFGIQGYHTDKTQVYLFGGTLPQEIEQAHSRCIEIERRIADQLIPGMIPSEIYHLIMKDIPPDFLHHFMGIGKRQVKFLGHGVGLNIDEYPVLAAGFDDPIVSGMTLAIEPKKGFPGIGMAGVEDTYLVTPSGGQCLTGGGQQIIRL